jgi:hypothetical protein
MGVPSISYRESIDETYDDGFYRLPNAVSHQCFNFDQLQNMIHRILAGNLGVADGNERRAIVKNYIASQDGSLACEKMVEVLASVASDWNQTTRTSLRDRLQRRLIADGYHLYKRLKPMLPGSHNRPEFQKHRYPGITLEALSQKIKRIQKVRNDTTQLKVEQLSDVLFQISP